MNNLPWKCITYDSCRLCQSREIIDICNFGVTAPANAYINPKNPSINEEFPLRLFLCSKCNSVQLKDTVHPSLLFKNYKYSSSTIPSLVKHFQEMAFKIREFIPQNFERKVLEIGSNDGVLLRHFKNLGFSVLGVEPSDNLAEFANQEGLETVCDFFNESSAQRILSTHGKFSVITCNNCFAHIDDIKSVVKGIKSLLQPNGFFVFENAYLLDTIKGLYFDQVYSEHLFYHSIKPLVDFFEQFDLEIFKVEHVNIQGGSIRVFVKHFNNKSIKIDNSVQKFINEEISFGLYERNTYQNFIEKINQVSQELNLFIAKESRVGKTFSAYGAAAKFTTFSSYLKFGDKIKYVVDDSPLKWGLLTPENYIPIINKEEFLCKPTDYCIITAWNFSDAIIKNNKKYLENGGKFLVPLPSLTIINQ